jgi:general stress protein 26
MEAQMPDFPSNPADVEHLLWDEIERHQVGMLVIRGGAPAHAQPMTAFIERAARRLWFFGDADSDLGHAASIGRPAVFAFQQHDLLASLSGQLQVRHDRARMDRFWNAVVAAWRPGGKNDPNLTLISMECDEAEVWLSTAGPMRFAWEIAKANATRRQPDLGGHTHLRFH